MSTHEPSAAIKEAMRKARLDGRAEMFGGPRLARYGYLSKHFADGWSLSARAGVRV
jgi:hypothetical protein